MFSFSVESFSKSERTFVKINLALSKQDSTQGINNENRVGITLS
jgi:hypothetical protein